LVRVSITARPLVVGADMVAKNWSLTTTSTTANQQIGSYTVPNGKIYHIVIIVVEVYYSTPSTTAALQGTLSVRWGTDVILGPLQAVNPSSAAPFGFIAPMPEGYEVLGDGSKTLNAVCTPAAVTSTVWKVSLIGFERW